jgi:hypothetical protein
MLTSTANALPMKTTREFRIALLLAGAPAVLPAVARSLPAALAAASKPRSAPLAVTPLTAR